MGNASIELEVPYLSALWISLVIQKTQCQLLGKMGAKECFKIILSVTPSSIMLIFDTSDLL